MFGQFLVRTSKLGNNVRFFRSNVVLKDAKDIAAPVVNSATKASPKVADIEHVLGAKMEKVTDFQRWLLVYFKKFPSKEEVPTKVTQELLSRTQTQARIRLANVMMVLTLVACLWAVISGKKEAQAGQTLVQANRDWHDQINREFREANASPKTT